MQKSIRDNTHLTVNLKEIKEAVVGNSSSIFNQLCVSDEAEGPGH